tara:strand:- start:1708 stop:2418 length:711 start_codon:yes stop_codon:yes gene_type:complete
MVETNKTSLITGGTRGIGSIITEVLNERGDHVITLSRRAENHPNHFSVDISSKKQLSKLTKSLESTTIDNLIFCHRYRGESWNKEFQISLGAVRHTIEALKTKFSSDCSIVIIGSNAGRFILDEQSLAYHVTRAALENLMRYYAVRLGPRGIRCNCVLPTTIIKPENKDFFTNDNPVRQLIEDVTPINRMGEASDIAYLVEFLCSDKASFITGQSIFVDGGISALGHESIARRYKK